MRTSIPLHKGVVLLLRENSAGIVDPGTVVLLPYFFDLFGGLLLDHGHLHDFSEFAGAGIGEGHPVCDSLEHALHYIYNKSHEIAIIVEIFSFVQNEAFFVAAAFQFDAVFIGQLQFLIVFAHLADVFLPVVLDH